VQRNVSRAAPEAVTFALASVAGAPYISTWPKGFRFGTRANGDVSRGRGTSFNRLPNGG
jgi:hypothetical protein